MKQRIHNYMKVALLILYIVCIVGFFIEYNVNKLSAFKVYSMLCAWILILMVFTEIGLIFTKNEPRKKYLTEFILGIVVAFVIVGLMIMKLCINSVDVGTFLDASTILTLIGASVWSIYNIYIFVDKYLHDKKKAE